MPSAKFSSHADAEHGPSHRSLRAYHQQMPNTVLVAGVCAHIMNSMYARAHADADHGPSRMHIMNSTYARAHTFAALHFLALRFAARLYIVDEVWSLRLVPSTTLVVECSR